MFLPETVFCKKLHSIETKFKESYVHHWLVFLSPAQVVFRFAPFLTLKAPAHLSFYRHN